jgi:hypothetical protein
MGKDVASWGIIRSPMELERNMRINHHPGRIPPIMNRGIDQRANYSLSPSRTTLEKSAK